MVSPSSSGVIAMILFGDISMVEPDTSIAPLRDTLVVANSPPALMATAPLLTPKKIDPRRALDQTRRIVDDAFERRCNKAFRKGNEAADSWHNAIGGACCSL